MYSVKTIRTEDPFTRMINFLKWNLKSYPSVEIETCFRFQIRFTADDYHNHLLDEHKTILAEHSCKHSMAPCQHYVYNYEAKKSFTVSLKKREYDKWGYYNEGAIGEINFFDPQEFPKLVSDNVGKSHSHKFVV